MLLLLLPWYYDFLHLVAKGFLNGTKSLRFLIVTTDQLRCDIVKLSGT